MALKDVNFGSQQPSNIQTPDISSGIFKATDGIKNTIMNMQSVDYRLKRDSVEDMEKGMKEADDSYNKNAERATNVYNIKRKELQDAINISNNNLNELNRTMISKNRFKYSNESGISTSVTFGSSGSGGNGGSSKSSNSNFLGTGNKVEIAKPADIKNYNKDSIEGRILSNKPDLTPSALAYLVKYNKDNTVNRNGKIVIKPLAEDNARLKNNLAKDVRIYKANYNRMNAYQRTKLLNSINNTTNTLAKRGESANVPKELFNNNNNGNGGRYVKSNTTRRTNNTPTILSPFTNSQMAVYNKSVLNETKKINSLKKQLELLDKQYGSTLKIISHTRDILHKYHRAKSLNTINEVNKTSILGMFSPNEDTNKDNTYGK